MTTDSMLDTQVRSLVGHIRQQQSQRLGQALDGARATARRLTARAHEDARRGARRAIEQGRESIREASERLAATRATRRRLERQRETQVLLRTAWPLLEQAVEDRWRSQAARRGWWQEALAQSAAMLLENAWTVEHPPEWSEAEQREAASVATSLGARRCKFVDCDDIVAGLRIRSGDACCDCTSRGLLAERHRIESELASSIGVGEPDESAAGGRSPD